MPWPCWCLFLWCLRDTLIPLKSTMFLTQLPCRSGMPTVLLAQILGTSALDATGMCPFFFGNFGPFFLPFPFIICRRPLRTNVPGEGSDSLGVRPGRRFCVESEHQAGAHLRRCADTGWPKRCDLQLVFPSFEALQGARSSLSRCSPPFCVRLFL